MKKFSVSAWAKDGEFGIRPIGSVEEAQIFLVSWPAIDRGPLYHAAASSIEAANAGSILPDEAKDTLVEFLDEADALAEERLAT
ncbi:DUF982 domain-containing protein [Mesorhizobium sp. A623]